MVKSKVPKIGFYICRKHGHEVPCRMKCRVCLMEASPFYKNMQDGTCSSGSVQSFIDQTPPFDLATWEGENEKRKQELLKRMPPSFQKRYKEAGLDKPRPSSFFNKSKI